MFDESIVFSKIESRQQINDDIVLYIGKVHVDYIYEYLIISDKDFYEPLSTRVDLKSFAEKLHRLSTTFVIVCKQETVGLIASYFYDQSSRKGFITLVHLKDKFRGKHLSDYLVKAVQTYAESINFEFVDLAVYRDNISAFNLYDKHDFKVLSEENGRCLMRWTSNK